MCLWHILSVKVQTSHSKRAVSPEQPSLLSHMHKMGVHMTYFSVNAQTRLSVHVVLPEPLLLSHMYEFGVHMAYILGNAQTILNMHAVLPEPSLLSHIHKMGVFMAYFISKVQTSLSKRAVSPEQPSLLSHMRKMGLHTAYSFSQCSNEPYCVCSLARPFTALAHAQNGLKYGIFFQSMLK